MPVFFNGRLWVTPAVMSLVDDSRMYNKNLSVGNILCIIGRSEGGAPLTPIYLSSPYEAKEVLRSGELLKACEKAFDPSPQTVGPSQIVAIRVNPAVQAAGALRDNGGNVAVILTSEDYGKYTSGLRLKVEAGSERGKKVTTQFGLVYYSADNIYRDAFALQYLGSEASATLSITGTQCVVSAPAGTVVDTIDLSDAPTVIQLVDKLNLLPDFDAVVLDGNHNKPTHQGLDFVADQDIKAAPHIATAELQAVVDWINGQAEGFLNAERVPNIGAALANVNWMTLTGGSDGEVTIAQWQEAFAALQAEDVQWVVPLSGLDPVHAMADTHCTYMSNVAGMERRCFVGTPSGTPDIDALLKAKNLNSDRTALMHIGFYDYDYEQDGKLALYPPYILAAQIGGAFSGVNPGTALTNKAVKVRGWERKLRNPTDTDRLITGGVLCVEDTKKGYKVTKSISTWLINKNYNRVEVSVGAAVDFVARNVRNAVEDLIGEKGTPQLLTLAIEKVDSILKELARPEPMGIGVLAGDAENPPYRNIIAEIDGDVMRIEFECSPVIPINYIPIVIHAVPWHGKVKM